MLRFEVDSDNKTISLEAQLKGQPAPLGVRGAGYRLIEEAGETRLQFEEIEASEEWLGVVLRFAKAADKGVKIPREYAELIRLAL